MKYFRVELKVCEGCGGLWIRAAGHGVYCRGCATRLSEFPPPRGRSRSGRKRKSHRFGEQKMLTGGQAVQIAVCKGGAR
jgi:hypothetical protein